MFCGKFTDENNGHLNLPETRFRNQRSCQFRQLTRSGYNIDKTDVDNQGGFTIFVKGVGKQIKYNFTFIYL